MASERRESESLWLECALFCISPSSEEASFSFFVYSALIFKCSLKKFLALLSSRLAPLPVDWSKAYRRWMRSGDLEELGSIVSSLRHSSCFEVLRSLRSSWASLAVL